MKIVRISDFLVSPPTLAGFSLRLRPDQRFRADWSVTITLSSSILYKLHAYIFSIIKWACQFHVLGVRQNRKMSTRKAPYSENIVYVYVRNLSVHKIILNSPKHLKNTSFLVILHVHVCSYNSL